MAAHHLLGKANEGNLILMAGPDYRRMMTLAEAAGMATLTPRHVTDIESLKLRVELSRESVVVIASMPEVEGRLDRSAFERNLIDLAYAADRVVYAGTQGAVLVWPQSEETRTTLRNGRVTVHQKLDVVSEGETVVGLTVDRL